jgi:thiomorpholine-carboxylate dehydrogenase
MVSTDIILIVFFLFCNFVSLTQLAIGAGTNHHSELAMDIYQSARVYVESSVGLQTELKGIASLVSGEIGAIIDGRKQRDADGMTNGGRSVFQSMGNAIEDGVMANLIYQKFMKL